MANATLVGRSDETYELIEKLGEGGFGSVYLARKRPLRKLVALKLLAHAVAPDAERRLWDEALLLASLHHPGIVAADDLVQVEGRLGLVTEYVEGEDLSVCLRDGMPASVLVEVIAQVAWALHASGRQGVVHRDVKPQNIRVGRHGNVKLLDFGIAYAECEGRSSDGPRSLYGTPRFMAPERFKCEFPPASDVFSLGCILWLGLEGTHFYGPHKSFEDVAPCTRSDARWRELLDRSAGHPAELEALLRRMLARSTEDRPTAAEVGQACEALLEDWPGRTRLSGWCRERWPDGVPLASALLLEQTPLSLAPCPDDEATEVARPALRLRPPPADGAPTLSRRGWFSVVGLAASAALGALALLGVGVAAVAVVGLPEPVAATVAAQALPHSALTAPRSAPERSRVTQVESPPAAAPAPRTAGRRALSRTDAVHRMIVDRVDALAPELQRCHAGQDGRWFLTFDVLPSGEVARVAVAGVDHPDGVLERCVVERVRGWRFSTIAVTQPVSRTLRF